MYASLMEAFLQALLTVIPCRQTLSLNNLDLPCNDMDEIFLRSNHFCFVNIIIIGFVNLYFRFSQNGFISVFSKYYTYLKFFFS